MNTRDLQFDTGEKTGMVSGLFARPPRARAVYVLAHGAGAGMRHAFMQAMAEALYERGIATLRYQFPYTEAGRKRPDRPPALLATVRAAVAEASRRARGLPVFAGGKSMGGRMTSMAAAAEPLPGVSGLIFLGYPLHPPGKEGTTRADHLDDVGIPSLFVQGTRDKLANLDLLRPVLQRVGPRAELYVVDGGDHSLHVLKRSGRTDDQVREEVADHIAAWIDRRSP
jgi:predicted alpha/beta-hydrolase family hydrolase